MSDVPSYDKPPTFQASDINAATSRLEGWRKLALQMQPSQGPGSGQLDPKNIAVINDAQWLRRFNLTVYQPTAGQPSQPSTPTSAAQAPAPQHLRLVAWRTADGSSITLDPVEVTAKAPQPQATQSPGLDLSSLRCVFNLKKSTNASPNTLYARIYNLSPTTMAKVLEYTRVQIQAGYVFSNYGLIFDGTVVQYVRGKENPVDTYLDIWAGDGDDALNNATSFRTFAAGSDVKAKYDEAFKNLKEAQADLQQGAQDQKTINQKLIRMHVWAGQVNQYSRELQLQHGQDIWIDNGQWNVVDRGSYLKGTALVLSPRTGLVDLPEVTPQGIQARCLLNPRLKLGGLVHIDSSILSGVPYLPGTAAQTDAQGNVIPGNPANPSNTSFGIIYNPAIYNQNFTAAFTSPTGTYKIILMNYHGDTRGQPWYCELTCLALNSNNQLMDSSGSALQRADPRYSTTGIGGAGA